MFSHSETALGLSPQGNPVIEKLACAFGQVAEVANCAFGCPNPKTLFVTAAGTLWRIQVTTPGRALSRLSQAY
jgi:hypothetical protein